jgi:hypothetical protein
MCQGEYVSLVLGLERMTIEVEVDPSLVALLMWCLFFALENEGGEFLWIPCKRWMTCQRT